MLEFEGTDHIVGPGGDDSNGKEADDTGNHAETVEDCWDRKDSQTNLRLHHECDTAQPSDLSSVSILNIACDRNCVHTAR